MSFSWISQTSSKFGERLKLVIKNLPWHLSQSEIENSPNFFFFWKILIKQILFFLLVLYSGKMLQLLLFWQLTVEREKNRKYAGLPKANSPSDSYILRILREMQCILHTGLEL